MQRLYEKIYNKLELKDLDGIYKRAGCLRPCHYLKYKLEGDRLPTSYPSQNFLFSLNSVSNVTFVETELLVHPWTSLAAEFGGSLGLFLAGRGPLYKGGTAKACQACSLMFDNVSTENKF